MRLENSLFMQEIPPKGASDGHLTFTSASIQPEDVALIGFIATLDASILFEKLHSQGTNIILHLDDGLKGHIIARREGDGLNFQWAPKEIEPNRMSDVQNRIADKIFSREHAQERAKPEAPKEEERELSPEEEDYLIKQLRRIP